MKMRKNARSVPLRREELMRHTLGAVSSREPPPAWPQAAGMPPRRSLRKTAH